MFISYKLPLMTSQNLSSVISITSYDSSSIASHYSSEAERETENETRSKHPRGRLLDPV
ncbi:3202_t:CDS:1 [Scutellospora calospora]|uniref:3202_t:CDS:1 n=1 Tax=Scutellospora calospora TaxID=85575 RepID=A0ACA9ML83_9GLOM|nr:3202_t:CDS:1 [Scutellospora calospora]